MDGVETIVLAVMDDTLNFAWIGEDPRVTVAAHRVIRPACLPELVDEFHIFFGNIVAIVMRRLPSLAGGLGCTVEIAGDDVPSDATLCQMIERRHAPRKQEGRLEG